MGWRTGARRLAISHTKAPESAFRLINQRYRWCRGTIQVLRKYLARASTHGDMRRPPLLLWLGLTYLLELVIMPLVNACAAVLLVLMLSDGGSLLPLAGWMGAFMGLNFAAGAFFVSVHRERFSTLAALPFYDPYHAFLLNGGLAIAALDELRGRSMRW